MGLKILVISHGVFSLSSNLGKTISGFFKEFSAEDISQLYFHTEVPTTDICKNYFRITDFDNLRKKKRDMGTRFGEGDIQKDLANERVDEGRDAQIYQLGRKRKPWMYIGRNMIWGLNKWKNDKLKAWLDEVNPDVIFFVSGDYTFAYDITMWVSKYKNIPIVTYVCDDYYFLKQKSVSPLYHLNSFAYKRTLKKLFKYHKNTVMICDELSEDYKKEFEINPTTIMTASDLVGKANEEKPQNEKIKISYIGNLGFKRYLGLIETGKMLLKLYNGEVLIDLYSTEKRPEITSLLTKENGIDFHGGISAAEVKKVIEETDVLMHIESLDEVNRKKVRHSVSTKIADSLASGKCLFAYGPKEVASMQHLIRNECAIVATKKEDLEKAVKLAVEDENARKAASENAFRAAEKYHSQEKNTKLLKEVLEKACL